jgi:hypothetical protein
MSVVPLELTIRPVETEEIELIPDVDALSESNRCSCAASDDNPY